MPQYAGPAAIFVMSILLLFAYEIGKVDYDPERICASQKDVSREQCLTQIDMALSAGW